MAFPRLANVLDPGRLETAFERVWRNRGMAGSDGVTVENFRRRLGWQLECLREDVLANRYRPQPVRRFALERPGRKPRWLMVPAVRDRVLQSAVAIELEPPFESLFDDASWGYRPQRSWQDGVAAVRRLRQNGLEYVLDGDIRACFDNIPHLPLLDAFSRQVRDVNLQALLLDWMRAEVREEGAGPWCPAVGIGQGSPLSPLLCNLYLTPLDRACRAAGLSLVRYADDFVVGCTGREAAQATRNLVEAELAALGLELSVEKTRIACFAEGFRFLGWDFLGDSCTPRPDMKRAPRLEDAPPAPAEAEPPPPGRETPRARAPAERRVEPAPPPAPQPLPPPDFPAGGGDDESTAPAEAPDSDERPRLVTLYLLEQLTTAGIAGDRIIVSRHGEVLREVLARQVDQIVVFGNITLTTPLLDRCLVDGIPIYLLSAQGRYFGLIDNFDNASVLLLREQLARSADPGFCLSLAREIVRGKLANSRTLLRRLARRHDNLVLARSIERIGDMLGKAEAAPDLDTLRGCEGAAAQAAFAGYAAVLDPAWGFSGRNRQPPRDPVNAMLSLGYTVLFQNALSLLRVAGLHPHVGFLHALTPGHPALASDLMEEHRAGAVDALVLDIALNGPLSPADFTLPGKSGEACLLAPEARKTFIRLLEQRFLTRLQYGEHSLERRRIIEAQARRLVAAIRANDATLYRAWVQR